jgi:hypothetical protein
MGKVNSLRFRLLCDGRSVGQSVLVSGPHLEPKTRFLLLLDICGILVVGRPPPPLTRGRVCNLLAQFPVILRPKFRRTHDHIFLFHLRLPQPGGPGPCICIPKEQRRPVITPGHWGPFLSPLTTRRATVELF